MDHLCFYSLCCGLEQLSRQSLFIKSLLWTRTAESLFLKSLLWTRTAERTFSVSKVSAVD